MSVTAETIRNARHQMTVEEIDEACPTDSQGEGFYVDVVGVDRQFRRPYAQIKMDGFRINLRQTRLIAIAMMRGMDSNEVIFKPLSELQFSDPEDYKSVSLDKHPLLFHASEVRGRALATVRKNGASIARKSGRL